MNTITQAFQPPLYWQQFEDLTEGVFRIVFNDPRPTKVGSPGQSQRGVDIIGHEQGNGRLVGIQCKRMDEMDRNNQPYPGGVISRKLLDDQIKLARGFSPALETWILATTAKRDVNIQRYALELHEESRSEGSFGIQVWFWDDFVTDLNRNHDLQQWYYANVIQVRSPDDQDKIILEMLGEAFARAAFRTPLHQETPSDFVQALKDTQHAINTGELKDRETRRVIRKTIGGRRAIADKTIADYLRLADEKLHDLRTRFQEHLVQKIIQQSGSTLQIPANVQRELTSLRSEAVAAINEALKHAGLPRI
jgi:hypothetical protein